MTVSQLLSLIGASFVLSFLLTSMMKRLAPRIGFVDKPGHRKIHHVPKPLGGGVAIFWAFALPMAAALIVHHVVTFATRPDSLQSALHGGVLRQTPLAVSFLVG